MPFRDVNRPAASLFLDLVWLGAGPLEVVAPEPRLKYSELLSELYVSDAARRAEARRGVAWRKGELVHVREATSVAAWSV